MDVAAMIGRPEDPAWAVWADQLQAGGDPRGELIALELVPEIERSPAQNERLAELYQPYIERFEAHARALLPGGWLAREVRRWRFGYVVELSLGGVMEVPEPRNYSALFGAEELRGLTSLALELAGGQVQPFLDALELHGPPLTKLMFFTEDAYTAFDEQASDRLWAALPVLEHLIWQGCDFAHFNHPKITTVSVVMGPGSAGYIGSSQVELVARSELPQLERLNIYGFIGFDPDDEPNEDEGLNHLLQDPQVQALLERLEVLDCPVLFESLFIFEDEPHAWPPFEALSNLRTRAKIYAGHGQEPIREYLPQLDIVFEEPPRDSAWSMPACGGRVISSWPCGRPEVEFGLGRAGLSQALVSRFWADMDVEQRRLATEFIVALDEAGVRGLPAEFERAALQAIVEILQSDDWYRSRTDAVASAIDQHRACCPMLSLMVEM